MANAPKDKDQEKGDEVLRRLLKTPPDPKTGRELKQKPKGAGDSINYVVLDGQFLVADILRHEGNSITADLYRNPTEFRAGAVMERNVKLDV